MPPSPTTRLILLFDNLKLYAAVFRPALRALVARNRFGFAEADSFKSVLLNASVDQSITY